MRAGDPVHEPDHAALHSLAVERLRVLIRDLAVLDHCGGHDGWYVAHQALMDPALRIEERRTR